MVFDVKFNSELNALEYYNLSELDINLDKLEIKEDFSSLDNDNNLDYINLFKNLNIEIFHPINDGEDFIYKFINFSFMPKEDKWTQHAVIGYSFKDVSPKAYEVILPIFKKVLDSKKNEMVKFYIFEDGYVSHYFKVNVVYSQGDIFLIFDDLTNSLKEYENATFDYTDVPTWYDVVPKAIIQDNKIIQVNKILADLAKRSEEEIKQFTVNDLNSVTITYNDTGLDLKFSDIIDLLLNGELSTINFNFLLKVGDEVKHFQGVGRKVVFQNKPAVFVSGLKELLENEIELIAGDNFDTIQEFSKGGFMVYDVKNKNYFWSKSFKELIEGEVKIETNVFDFFYPLVYPEDVHNLDYVLENISIENPRMDTEFRIKTKKGNLKYLHLITQLNVKDGEIIEYLNILKDVSDYRIHTEELNRLNFTVKDVQKATSISVHYMDSEGKYHWTPETYSIIERSPRDTDEDSQIIKDLLIPSDQIRLDEIYDNLKPNEFYYIKDKLTLITESGKVKYLTGAIRKYYNRDGVFVQRSEFAQDVTEEVLRNQELLSLNATVEDVQTAAQMSVHFLNEEGKYFWTSETYKLIDREPRESDYKHHIIFELLSKEDYVKISGLIDSLGPNEFLGNYIFPITTEKGNVKHIQINARPIYDEEGNFVRRSGYAMDVTNQVEFEKAIMKADAEKTVLIKEVHHRVKNNLQVITSFISLEERFRKSEPEKIIEITKNRINALALIHETIYNEENMDYITIKEFIGSFDNKLAALSHQDIGFVNDFEDLTLSIDIVTPLTLMINELTSNSFKYAFVDNKGYKEIFKSIHMVESDGVPMCKFHYKDNGVGLPEGYDINTSRSLGWTIIKSLSSQLDGEYELFNDDGLNFTLTFPVK